MNNCQLAEQIANDYNWPVEAKSIERGVVPPDFRLEVARAIVLFLQTPPLGGMLQSKKDYEDMRTRDRIDAKKLCELRVLLSKINKK